MSFCSALDHLAYSGSLDDGHTAYTFFRNAFNARTIKRRKAMSGRQIGSKSKRFASIGGQSRPSVSLWSKRIATLVDWRPLTQSAC